MLKLVAPLDASQFQLVTKARSLQLGRRLYRIEQQDQHYWLKLHLPETEPICEQAFQRELRFYRAFDQQNLSAFLLPYQMVELQSLLPSFCEEGEGIVLPHGQAFWPDPLSLTLAEMAHIIWVCLCGVDELHQLGWIHGDLKHEHFVLWQGQLKLIDFEQAYPIDQPAIQNLTATPRYMAPELFHAQAKSVQTDLYALGIILYEWLGGQRFSARSYQDWAVLHCQTLKIALPDERQVFEHLLQGLLAKHSQQRFSSLQQAKQAFIAINLLKNDHN